MEPAFVEHRELVKAFMGKIKSIKADVEIQEKSSPQERWASNRGSDFEDPDRKYDRGQEMIDEVQFRAKIRETAAPGEEAMDSFR